MSTAPAPTREQCVRDFAQSYRAEWDELWEGVRRHGAEHATRSAADPEKARQRLEEIQAAGRTAA